MPVTTIPVERLRNEWIRGPQDLFRRYSRELTERGFNMTLPIDVERNETHLVLKQEPPNRIGMGNMRLPGILQRLQMGVTAAIPELQSLLLEHGDDRAATLAGLEVDMPQDAMVMDDFGTTTDGHSTQQVPAEKLAGWLLCQKAMVLMGAKNEPIK